MQSPAPGKEEPLETMQAGDSLAGAQRCGKDLGALRKAVTSTWANSVSWQQRRSSASEAVLTGPEPAGGEKLLSSYTWHSLAHTQVLCAVWVSVDKKT